MKRILLCTIKTIYVLIFFCFGLLSSVNAQCLPNLGSASNFVLFTTTGAVGNLGTSYITGDVGSNAGAVNGFEAPSVLNGNVHIANSVTSQASSDLVAAYNQLYAMTPTNTTHAPGFGSETIFPGVYNIGGAGSVDGILILDGQGNSNAIFAFKIGGAFTTGAGATIVLTNGARASNVIWIADGAVAMAANTTMSGTLIANGAISIGDGGILHGRLLSTTGAISIYNTNSQSQGVETSDAVGGTVSSNQAICSGYSPADLILTGNTGSVAQWEKSTDAAFTSPTSIFSTATTLTGITIGNLTATTYFRARIQSTNCSIATSSYVTITVGTATNWDGSVWSNGIPINISAATISSNYTSSSDLTACSLTVTNNAVVVIAAGHTVTLNGALTVAPGSTFTLENSLLPTLSPPTPSGSSANLLQGGTTNMNSGEIVVKRYSSALMRLDYTLWSSPVATQKLQAFSPGTLSNRFYTYATTAAPTNNVYVVVPSPSTTDFATGKGYLIRTPNSHPTTPTNWNGVFTGVPNNGNYSYALDNNAVGQRYNLVGNPYPSPLNAVAFVTDNSANITGTLYFWRKTNNTASPSYCTWTTAGFNTNGEMQVIDPNDVIQTGQGFFVEATATGTTLNFTNSMRIDNHANQFFRSAATVERHRIWLNATNAVGAYSQAMVCYMTGATMDVDPKIDGKYLNNGAIAFTSILGADVYAIQGRSLPFDSADVVPMQFKVTAADTYTIAIDHVDGLFATGQGIYLRDLLTGIVQDLTAGGYTFACEAGTFANRFEIIYSNSLGTTPTTFDAKKVVLYKSNDELVINTGAVLMAGVKIFDIRGRLLVEKKAINASDISLQVGFSNEVLLVKVTSIDGIVVTKKVVL